jgi:hypothetical protein
MEFYLACRQIVHEIARGFVRGNVIYLIIPSHAFAFFSFTLSVLLVTKRIPSLSWNWTRRRKRLLSVFVTLLPLGFFGFLAGANVDVEAVSSESLLNRLLALMTMPEKWLS